MEERVNYSIVGAFVVTLTIVLVAVGYWLSSTRHHKAHDTYIVYMKEAVAGLNVMAPVKYNGVVVGFVKDISIDKKNSQFVRLLLSIEHTTPVTQSTVASLLPQGITGMTYIGLKTTKASAPKLKRLPGEDYPIIASEPSLFVYFGDALLSATNNLNRISQRFDKLFNEKSVADLTDSFNHIATISHVVDRQLPTVLVKLQQTLDSIYTMSSQLDKAGSKVNVTLQDVSQQALPEAVRTLQNLDHMSQHLQQLTSEVEKNPSIVIRGRQAALGPGEH